MLPPEVDVRRPGDKKAINGFDCEHVIITMRLPFENTKTGEKGALRFVSDLWVAPVAQAKEIQAFNRAYAQKLGLDADAQSLTAMMGPQGARFAGGMADLAAKMRDLNGYPIMTTVSMGDDAMGTDQAQASRAPEPKEGGSPLGKIGGLGGMFGKKKAPESNPPESAPAAGPTGSLMTITTEVKSISTDPIPDGEFEVPAGFKKVERKR